MKPVNRCDSISYIRMLLAYIIYALLEWEYCIHTCTLAHFDNSITGYTFMIDPFAACALYLSNITNFLSVLIKSGHYLNLNSTVTEMMTMSVLLSIYKHIKL